MVCTYPDPLSNANCSKTTCICQNCSECSVTQILNPVVSSDGPGGAFTCQSNTIISVEIDRNPGSYITCPTFNCGTVSRIYASVRFEYMGMTLATTPIIFRNYSIGQDVASFVFPGVMVPLPMGVQGDLVDAYVQIHDSATPGMPVLMRGGAPLEFGPIQFFQSCCPTDCEVFDQVTMSCIPATCPPGQTCQGGACVPSGMGCTPPCDPNEVCNMGVCECAGGPACGPTEYCDAMGMGCMPIPQCNPGETFNPVTGVCECFGQPTCGAGEYCDQGTMGCEMLPSPCDPMMNPCPPGYTCDPMTMQCIPGASSTGNAILCGLLFALGLPLGYVLVR